METQIDRHARLGYRPFGWYLVLLFVAVIVAYANPARAATICVSGYCEPASGGTASSLPASDGTDGALLVTDHVTLDLQADNIFNFTSITIEAGGLLDFRNVGTDTTIQLLATENVLIAGTLDTRPGALVIVTSGSFTLSGAIYADSSLRIAVSQGSIEAGSTISVGGSVVSDPNVILGPSDSRVVLEPGPITIAPVPLPGALPLLASALALLSGFLSRRRTLISG
jgi:hypothetical protein